MKNLKFIIFFLLFFIIGVVAYKNLNIYLNPQIVPMKISESPLDGAWKVDRYAIIGNTDLSEKDIKDFIGKKASFNVEEVHFNNEVCKHPSFKIKIVDSKDFFWNSFKIKPESIDISQSQVKVITVTSNNNFFDEYVQIDDNTIMKSVDGVALFLKKYGSETNEKQKSNFKVEKSKTQTEISSKSGLLLGIKSKDLINGGYKYKTLWVSYSYGNSMPISEVPGLIVPRKIGFWKIGVDKVKNNSLQRDLVWGYPIKNIDDLKDNSTKNYNESYGNNEILFLGNEYISLANTDLDNQSLSEKFSVFPIDNIRGNSVKFSKAFGKDGENALGRSISNIERLNENVDMNELDRNWSVIRRSGRWILRGRVNSKDFDIAFDTPKVLTTYDDLYPSFKKIKERFPEAVDAYSSPNKDFVVIITKEDLLVVDIKNNNLKNVKVKFKLEESEQPVMAQWSTGSYVDEWGKLFKK